MLGMDKMCSWISGARQNSPTTGVTRARVMPSRGAMAAWLAAPPESRRACRSRAFRRSSTTRGVLGSLGGLGLPRQTGTALTIRSEATRRVRAPTLPFPNAPLGPSAISTVCSRHAALGAPSGPPAATCSIRNQTSGCACRPVLILLRLGSQMRQWPKPSLSQVLQKGRQVGGHSTVVTARFACLRDEETPRRCPHPGAPRPAAASSRMGGLLWEAEQSRQEVHPVLTLPPRVASTSCQEPEAQPRQRQRNRCDCMRG